MISKTMVALDFSTRKEMYGFLLKFQEPIYVRVGMELTYSLGFEIIRGMKAMGHQIFLDPRLHNIPNTVKQVIKNLAKLDVDVVNLHTAGGSAMMKAATEGLEEGAIDGKRPLCIAVTQLTSTSDGAMDEEPLVPGDVRSAVIFYAELTKENGLDGVVRSVHEVKAIHEARESSFLTVTSGIRLVDDSKDDQKRVTTPAFAKERDCDYIVVGGSVTKSVDPVATYHEIEKAMEGK